VIGWSYIPIFLDLKENIPATEATKKFKLQEGAFQLPVFCERPTNLKSLSIDNINNFERIPCCSIQIRLEESPKDEQGRPITEATNNSRFSQNLISKPLNYQDGEYSNYYYPLEKPLEN
jgi:hypothetical protein